ncbi:MAG: polysaccharide biosynthesis protein, partial [Bacteroidia bacterium]|nr:polysaccharide biosynthesis protein [Bacteroidia bacterium]
LLSALLCIFSQPIASILQYPNHSEYVIYFALIVALDALSALPFAKLRHEEKALRFSVIKLINIATNIGLNLFFLIYCPAILKNDNHVLHSLASAIYNPNIGVAYIFISNLIASAIAFLLLLPDFLQSKFEFNKEVYGKMLTYALPLLVAGFAGMVNETLDRILIKYLVTEKSTAMHQLGIYGANYKLAMLMTIFIQTFRYAAEPFFFSDSKNKNSKETLAKVLKYFVIVALFIFLSVTLFIDFFKHFIGEEYHSGVKIVPILLLANFCLGVFFNLSIWYKITEQTKYGAYFAFLGAVITICGNFLLIPEIGYMGAAYTTLICYATMMLFAYFTGKKHYPIPYEVGRIITYIILALLLFVLSGYISLKIPKGDMLIYIVNSGLLLVYFLLVYALERGKKSLT